MAARRRGPRLERHDGYRVLVGGPVPPQADAITLGRLIIVRQRAAASEALLAHELVHVRQFAELGWLRFLARYVGSYLRGRLGGYGHMAAYRRIPLEVEASWFSRVHGRAGLEPGAGEADAGDAPAVSRSRAPRPAVAQRLQDEAERLTRDALNNAAGPALRPRPGTGTPPPASPGGGSAGTKGPRAQRRWARLSTSRRRKRTAPPRR